MSVTTPDDAAAQAATARIDALDLEPVVFKLLHPERGQASLSLAEADAAVSAYRPCRKFRW